MSTTLDIASRVARRVYAAKRYELLGKTNRDLRDNSRGLSPKFVKRDGSEYVFRTGSKDYEVRVQVEGLDPDENDVKLSCSCPAWQYQGPEYHARTENYLLGSPRGTAIKPKVRDAKGDNRLCKHAVAVLRRLERYLSTES
jgi:hypothetical protein